MKIHLSKCAQPENYGKVLISDIIISGKKLAPYMIPTTITIKCNAVKCNTKCAFVNNTIDLIDTEANTIKNAPLLLTMIQTPQKRIPSIIKEYFGIKNSCSVEVTIDKMSTLESVVMIPEIQFNYKNSESTGDNGEYVVRAGYVLRETAECNKTYTTTMITIPDPTTNMAVHFIYDIKPKQAFTDSLHLHQNELKHCEIFRPDQMTVESIWDKLHYIEHMYEQGVTMIYDRFLLSLAVDLTFHSVLHFYIDKEYIHKGWGEILLLGDTQCGKGATSERLSQYFNLGEVVSGENCTFVGLVGGIQQVNQEGMLTWGRVVLNNKRLVIIDEISSMALEGVLRKMSRLRSEGVSEIDKGGVHSRADSCTRLIWITNPVAGKELKDYEYGCQALAQLIDTAEDISRFDYVLTVMRGEVSSELINQRRITPRIKLPQKEDINLLLWTWSRRPKQIIFEPRAIDAIFKYAQSIPNKYSGDIPLVQSENYRIKLAKVAVEIAARLFISESPYEELYVPKECIEVAVEFLEKVYSAPGLKYDKYSFNKLPIEQRMSEEDKTYLSKLPPNLVEYLKNNKYFAIKHLQSVVNSFEAKAYANDLLAHNVITRYFSSYISNIYE